MPLQKQLSVFMENRPGLLARTLNVLADANINVMAMAVHDTVDSAVVRFLVDYPTKALLLLEQEGLFVQEHEVVMAEISNDPGELTTIARKLAEADINIQYAYCTATVYQQSGCLVIKTDQPEQTLDIISGTTNPPDTLN